MGNRQTQASEHVPKTEHRRGSIKRQHSSSRLPCLRQCHLEQTGIWYEDTWPNDSILLDAQSSHLPGFSAPPTMLTFSLCKLFGSRAMSLFHLSRLTFLSASPHTVWTGLHPVETSLHFSSFKLLLTLPPCSSYSWDHLLQFYLSFKSQFPVITVIRLPRAPWLKLMGIFSVFSQCFAWASAIDTTLVCVSAALDSRPPAFLSS